MQFTAVRVGTDVTGGDKHAAGPENNNTWKSTPYTVSPKDISVY